MNDQSWQNFIDSLKEKEIVELAERYDNIYGEIPPPTIPPEPKKPQFKEYNLTEETFFKISAIDKKAGGENLSNLWMFLIGIIALVYSINISNNSLIVLSLLYSVLVFSFVYYPIRLHLFKEFKNYTWYKNDLIKYNDEMNVYKIIKAKHKLEEIKKEKELQKKQYDYWLSLNPYVFEKEMAILFEKQGYSANVTKGSGDGGIDIELEKENVRGIVQCKLYQEKVGPGPVRDLFGSMVAGNYKYGYIVNPSGFSDNAYEFSKGKNINLIDLKQIMLMVNNEETQKRSDNKMI